MNIDAVAHDTPQAIQPMCAITREDKQIAINDHATAPEQHALQLLARTGCLRLLLEPNKCEAGTQIDPPARAVNAKGEVGSDSVPYLRGQSPVGANVATMELSEAELSHHIMGEERRFRA